MQRRTKQDIWVKILEICLTPSTKTTVVYQANLNFKTVLPHLKLLVDKGWLETDGSLYSTTTEGKKVIDIIRSIENNNI